MDCIGKYITDFSIISTLFTDISIQLSVLNGWFYVDFYQKFSVPDFYKAFLKQLEKLNLDYVQIAKEKELTCHNIIPDFFDKSITEQESEEISVTKFSDYKLFNTLVIAFEESNFTKIIQELLSKKYKHINGQKYILDNDVLNLISKKLSNPVNMIPFFVILFFLPSINSVNCDLENLGCPEILLQFFTRLLAIKEKIRISSKGEFSVISDKKGLLVIKKVYESEILYVIVNISDSDEVIHLSDKWYWTDLFSSEIYKSIQNFKCNVHEFYLLYHTE